MKRVSIFLKSRMCATKKLGRTFRVLKRIEGLSRFEGIFEKDILSNNGS